MFDSFLNVIDSRHVIFLLQKQKYPYNKSLLTGRRARSVMYGFTSSDIRHHQT